MSMKLILTWDITPEKEQEYFEFVIRDFIPGVQRLGLDLTDAWATVYGERPQIQVGALVSTFSKFNHLIRSPEWKDLNDRLLEFVENYQLKLIESRSGFQF
jgi:hypothetical protein